MIRLCKSSVLALLVGIFLVPALCWGASFPSKPITLVVPYSAGGGTDVQARALASVAEKYFDQPIVVVNKAGGGGAIGTAFVAGAKPDGHTLLFSVPAVLVIKPFMVKTTYTFDDLKPLMRVSDSPRILMARKNTPWKNFKEMDTYARENPGKVIYASAGTGTTTHIAMEGMALQSDLELTHIPFKGCAKAVAAVLGGHADLFRAIPSECYQYFDSGEAWPVAVFSSERLKELSQIPTLKELGVDFTDSSSRGLFVPEGVPQENFAILAEGFRKATEDPKLQELFAKLQERVSYLSGEEFETILRDQKDLYGKVLEKAGLKKF